MAEELTTPDPDAPKSVTIDDQTVSAHSLRDQMEASDKRKADAVAANRGLGIRFSKICPGGAV